MINYYNKVVIIDTGITIDETMLSYKRLVYGFRVKKNAGKYEVTSIKNDLNCINDDVGHGTGIAELIVSHNKDAELIIVKIFDSSTQFVDEELLIFTLDYLLESKIEFDLVNISMGLCCVDKTDTLYEICRLSFYATKFYTISGRNK